MSPPLVDSRQAVCTVFCMFVGSFVPCTVYTGVWEKMLPCFAKPTVLPTGCAQKLFVLRITYVRAALDHPSWPLRGMF